MRKKVARKLQKVASCNGMGRATCNFRELPGAFTYENPLLQGCNKCLKKKGSYCSQIQSCCSL